MQITKVQKTVILILLAIMLSASSCNGLYRYQFTDKDDNIFQADAYSCYDKPSTEFPGYMDVFCDIPKPGSTSGEYDRWEFRGIKHYEIVATLSK